MKYWDPKPGEYADIDSRAKFRVRLAEVLALANKCLARTPGDPALASIARQLEAMTRNTANDRDPTETERRGISAGVIAVRELRGSPDNDVAKLDDAIHAVVTFYSDWPEDSVAAALAVGGRQ